jgi:NAD-dependent DNA ligase
MISKTDLEELELLGFGANIDALESYVMHLRKMHANGESEVSDKEYDGYMALLKRVKPDSVVFLTNWEEEDYTLEEYDCVLEEFPMKSILTVTNMEQLIPFKDMLERDFAQVDLGDEEDDLGVGDYEKGIDLVGSYKLNGHGVRATYRFGALVSGTKRGRRNKGRDITDQMKVRLPRYIMAWRDIEYLEIRGEQVVDKSVFEALKDTCKTPLSTVTHLTRASASREELELVDYLFYNILVRREEKHKIEQFETLSSKIDYLRRLGFDTPDYKIIHNVNADNFDDKVDELLNSFTDEYLVEGTYPYDCDGIVVAIDNVKDFYDVAERYDDGNYYRSNFALKMGAAWDSDKYDSVIEEIEWCFGKSVVTPKAKIRPTMTANGATVTTVPLYNVGVMEKYELYPGSTIWFKFGGETGVTLCDSNGDRVSAN